MIVDDLESPTFLILLSGPLAPTARLKALCRGTRIIAADSGMQHAATLGLTPELWVGDFDSTDPALAGKWPNVPREPYPAAKNETDGAIAVEAALVRGARSLILAGALGGPRSDHALAHFAHGMALAEKGSGVVMTSGEEEAVPLGEGPRTFDLPAGSLFSIIGFSTIEKLSITGARYPLKDHHAPFGTTRTVSNVAEGPITISHSGGRALLIARPYDLSGA